MPSDWDADFAGFLTVGAFEVDARIRDGRARALRVHSLRGNRCRVVNPWPDVEVDVMCAGDRVAYDRSDGLICFDTQPGASYSLCPADSKHIAPLECTIEPACGPQHYIGPAYLGEIAPETRIPVWLGLHDAPAIPEKGAE